MTHKPAIVVLGAPRSGVSALTEAFVALGFAPPADCGKPQARDAGGRFISPSLQKLCDEMLALLGGRWNRPGPFVIRGQSLDESRKQILEALTLRFREPARKALSQAFPGKPAIVLGDPRLSLLWPVFGAALRAEGFSPHYLLAYRNPLEVSASLHVSDKLGAPPALQLWLNYTLQALERELAGGLVGAVELDALVGGPFGALRPILAAAASAGFDTASLPGEEVARRELGTALSAGGLHHVLPKERVERSPMVPSVVKSAYALLGQWQSLSREKRELEIKSLTAAFQQFNLLAGQFIMIEKERFEALQQGEALTPAQPSAPEKAEKAAPVPPLAAPAKGDGSRPLVLMHYHLFKNAGTSVDKMLKANFGELWLEREFALPTTREVKDWPFNADRVAEVFAARPDLLVLSSHTALLPLPKVDGAEVFPIIFVRHPIDRLKSSYVFERAQDSSGFGPQLAKSESFAGYVRGMLAHKTHRGCRSFQAYRLSFNEPAERGSELERALRVIDSFPFIGLVEAYDESMRRLEAKLGPRFPSFKAVVLRANHRRPNESDDLEQRLFVIREELGDELYAEVCAANRDDIYLHQAVSARYFTAMSGSGPAAALSA